MVKVCIMYSKRVPILSFIAEGDALLRTKSSSVGSKYIGSIDLTMYMLPKLYLKVRIKNIHNRILRL